MKPDKDTHVKCFLRNASVIEGIVVEWSSEVILKSLDEQSLLIIHAPLQDIMLTKIVLTETIVEPVVQKPKRSVTELQKKLKEKLYEVQKGPEDSELKEKTIEELKVLVAEQEREIIAKKKQEHFGTSTFPKLTHYSSQDSLLSKIHAYVPQKDK